MVPFARFWIACMICWEWSVVVPPAVELELDVDELEVVPPVFDVRPPEFDAVRVVPSSELFDDRFPPEFSDARACAALFRADSNSV